MVLRVEKQREVQVMFREGAKCNALLCLQEHKALKEYEGVLTKDNKKLANLS